MSKFELTKKQIEVIKALENIGYKVKSYTFAFDNGIGMTTKVTYTRGTEKSCNCAILDITDFDTW